MTETETPKRRRRTRAEMEAARAEAAQTGTARAEVVQTGTTQVSTTESPSRKKNAKNKDTHTPPNNVVAPAIPEPNGELMPDSIIRVFSFLAKSNVSPYVYTDTCDLMKSCIEFKNTFKLTDDKFIELMHAFEPLQDKKK